MDAEFLKQNVGEPLSEGLATLMLQQPPDSVEFLGNWLLNYVASVRSAEAKAKEAEALRIKDAKAVEAALLAANEKASIESTKQKFVADREQRILDILEKARTSDELFQQFAEAIRDLTTADCYIAEKSPEDELKYIAATGENKFLLQERLPKGTGVTWDLFDEDQEEPEEAEEELDPEAEDYEEKKKAQAEARFARANRAKTVFVANTLMGPLSDRLHFYKLPQFGSYFSMRIRFDATLDDEVLEDAEAKQLEIESKRKGGDDEEKRDGDGDEEKDEDEEEEKQAASATAGSDSELTREQQMEQRLLAEQKQLMDSLTKKRREYALCIDTLNQKRRLTNEEVAQIIRFGKLFNLTLERIDRETFAEELKKRRYLSHLNSSLVADLSNEDNKEAQLEKIRQSLDKDASEEDVQFHYRKSVVQGLRAQLAEFRTYNVFRGPLVVLQALFYLLDYTKADISERDGKPSWGKMRTKFGDEMYQRIITHNPRLPKTPEPYASLKAIQKLLKDVNGDELRAKNAMLAELYAFTDASIKLRAAAVAERKAAKAEAARLRKEEEEAARQKAEEEEAERLAAAEADNGEEAAEAAANADEGDDDV